MGGESNILAMDPATAQTEAESFANQMYIFIYGRGMQAVKNITTHQNVSFYQKKYNFASVLAHAEVRLQDAPSAASRTGRGAGGEGGERQEA